MKPLPSSSFTFRARRKLSRESMRNIFIHSFLRTARRRCDIALASRLSLYCRTVVESSLEASPYAGNVQGPALRQASRGVRLYQRALSEGVIIPGTPQFTPTLTLPRRGGEYRIWTYADRRESTNIAPRFIVHVLTPRSN